MSQRTFEHLVTDNDLLVTKLNDGQLWVLEIIVVDGEKTHHRHVIMPGQSFANEDVRVRDVAQRVHTPTVITDYNVAEAARRLAERR